MSRAAAAVMVLTVGYVVIYVTGRALVCWFWPYGWALAMPAMGLLLYGLVVFAGSFTGALKVTWT